MRRGLGLCWLRPVECPVTRPAVRRWAQLRRGPLVRRARSAAVIACAAAGALLAVAGEVQALPSFAEVRAAHRPSDLTLLDRHGTPIQTLRTDPTVRRLAWVPLQEVSPALLHAIVLSEDRSFHAHSGVDWAAAARSAWANLWNTRTRGASTLTMQLAGLLDEDLARPAGGRSLGQKVGQIVAARQLEARWQKSEILEAYLNRVAFRGELVGIQALSQTLFGKFPSGLDQQEAAITAALLRGPNAPAATVVQRACGVLTQQGADCRGLTALTETALVRRPGMPLGEQLAPHAARQLKAEPAAAVLRTTIDAGLQRVAIASLRQHLAVLLTREVEDGAAIVLDNRSGEVLAWVGSGGPASAAPQVDGVLARRQPGSTLKPFVYGLAFERRLITPASLLDDSPAQLATRTGLYVPQNYDRSFKGWVSARTALGASLNIPAVRVAAMLPPDGLVQRLNEFGLALPHSGGHYGHALALGGAEVTLAALTNAYRALANGGLYTPIAPLRADRPAPAAPRRVADAAATHLVADILADNNARVLTFGFDSVLATHGWAAVKTGTSKDMRDNWCIGFTDRYTVGVWVGNASGAPMRQVSGVSGAAPVWQALVQALHAGAASQPPAVPAGVVAMTVRHEGPQTSRFAPGPPRGMRKLGGGPAFPHEGGEGGRGEAARPERFLAGTEQAVWRAGSEAGGGGAPRRHGISQPRDGSLFAIDPDIPPAAQRIRFEGEPVQWVLDGRRLGSGPSLSWAPWPGRHELQLRARDGRVIQTVRFEVRGAGLKTAAVAGGPSGR